MHSEQFRPGDVLGEGSDVFGSRVGDQFFSSAQLVDHTVAHNGNSIGEPDCLVEVVRPEIDTGKRGFPELGVAQRRFLIETLGQFPRESQNPRYDPKTHADHFCKFILPGVRKVIPAEHARVYDKLGRAYGFSIENAYVEDQRTGRGFFLAIVVYTNPNGLLNDDRYAYEKLADPFLEAVGELVTRAVLGGER